MDGNHNPHNNITNQTVDPFTYKHLKAEIEFVTNGDEA